MLGLRERKARCSYTAHASRSLPLDTLQITLAELLPKVEAHCASSDVAYKGDADERVLAFLREQDLSQVLPPAPPVCEYRVMPACGHGPAHASLLLHRLETVQMERAGAHLDPLVPVGSSVRLCPAAIVSHLSSHHRVSVLTSAPPTAASTQAPQPGSSTSSRPPRAREQARLQAPCRAYWEP